MKEKLVYLKNKASEKAEYYFSIGFPNLAEDFTEFVNFFNEIESLIERAPVQVQDDITEAAAETQEE